ncbi:MAG: DNA-3-methyladenine glycosylase I [Desulfobacterales bacterium]|nr:DNA-3-methyladenine glycosylase I [Desulfobacterales bacterium]
MDNKPRCAWAGPDPLYIRYHDTQWGVPQHDDRRLFEFLILEGFQAGLNWLTILKKRSDFQRAFHHFDPEKISRYDNRKITELLSDRTIIRNRLKIEAAVHNAGAFLTVKREYKTFDAYIWQFTGERPKSQAWKTPDEIPSQTAESILMSKDLKKRGFKFVGPVICYAFIQAVGMVNDHTTDCFRFHELSKPL